jgi:hypothetical protein
MNMWIRREKACVGLPYGPCGKTLIEIEELVGF